MSTNTIRAIIKEPGKDPEVRWIKNELEELQSIVGGYVEAHTLDDDYGVVLCDEDGVANLKAMNFWLDLFSNRYRWDYIVGTAIFVDVDARNERFIGLTEDQIEEITQTLKLAQIREKFRGEEGIE